MLDMFVVCLLVYVNMSISGDEEPRGWDSILEWGHVVGRARPRDLSDPVSMALYIEMLPLAAKIEEVGRTTAHHGAICQCCFGSTTGRAPLGPDWISIDNCIGRLIQQVLVHSKEYILSIDVRKRRYSSVRGSADTHRNVADLLNHSRVLA